MEGRRGNEILRKRRDSETSVKLTKACDAGLGLLYPRHP